MAEAPGSGLDFVFAEVDKATRYKLLSGVIVPRPIAFVTTLSEDGVVNAAPYSFFNVFSDDPPLIVLGLQRKPDRTLKDTTRNIDLAGEFVVNMVDEPMAAAMNDAAADFPADISEPEVLGLALAPSSTIRVPRLAAAPFALECKRTMSLAFSSSRELLIGEVTGLHARAGMLDIGTLRVDFAAYRPVGRLFGDLYTRQTEIFALKRRTPAEVLADRQDGAD
ncbi:MAG: flavin reductase family protein [Beijerinckiaceae bacterium]|nr:flavin reductase family protein [Beijerinckiaceae bacterium]MCZ8299718.1 flavin reductase family protein [Beijerinckiaceae bacterium]